MKISIAAAAMLLFALISCNDMGNLNTGTARGPISPQAGQSSCVLVPSGAAGAPGAVAIHAQAVATGLEVPWEVAFLPGGDWLVTERPGRLRLLRQGQLEPSPVMTVSTVSSGEGGLLGLALDPGFSANSAFYVYYTDEEGSGYVNRVQRYTLSADHSSATAGQVILDGIAWNTVHNGGRIKFGPDGKLYVSAGEGASNTVSQDPTSPSGKILRINSDGSIPADNPDPGEAWFIEGLRNTEAFDWWDPATIVLADNGPTGEYLGRTGGDKLMIAQKGQNMGWPNIWHCETASGMITPILTWTDAVPPGGLWVYHGSAIPTWDGSILIASTGASQLHRVALAPGGAVALHEVYLDEALGRLRSVLQGPDGALYVTTTNCDSRGTCPDSGDGIYRILAGH